MHCIYGAHLGLFFFPLRFPQSHRLRRPGCYDSIHWAFVLHGGSHLFEGSYDLNIHVQLISPVLFFGSSTVDATWVLFVFVLFFKIFPDGFFMPGQFTKKRGLFYHLSRRCVSYCMSIFDCRKRLAFVSLLPIIIGKIVMFFFFLFSAIPDTTRLCLAIHPAPISAIGPPLVRYLMTA